MEKENQKELIDLVKNGDGVVKLTNGIIYVPTNEADKFYRMFWDVKGSGLPFCDTCGAFYSSPWKEHHKKCTAKVVDTSYVLEEVQNSELDEVEICPKEASGHWQLYVRNAKL